jgi:hypothetical protein
MSMDASGQLGKALVFAKWKGRAYCREYVIPENPRDPKQENVRYAFLLLVALWQIQTGPNKLLWDAFAKPFAMSGFNAFVGRGMLEYVVQITTTVMPVSVTELGIAPADVWTWA